jgi:hypothetical protein
LTLIGRAERANVGCDDLMGGAEPAVAALCGAKLGVGTACAVVGATGAGTGATGAGTGGDAAARKYGAASKAPPTKPRQLFGARCTPIASAATAAAPSPHHAARQRLRIGTASIGASALAVGGAV